MQLTQIHVLQATLRLVSGLHIGSGDNEMHIGGTDSPVIKNPLTNQPYIPGSSLKGKIRSLLEWRSGAVKERVLDYQDYLNAQPTQQAAVKHIIQLFGLSGSDKPDEQQAREIGPSRLAFWDCALNVDWCQSVQDKNLLLTEVKMENSINRISGTADNPRNIERVPAGAEFDFKLSMKQLNDEDLLHTVLQGLKLLEMDSLGGSGSRGYGKVAFINLTLNGECLQQTFADIQPFEKPEAA